jgi:two-component system, chemotaxis family, CheB/CheR fusion protein
MAAVEARSDGEGTGSEFVVRLPLLREQPEVPLPAVRTSLGLPDTAKIVVVEDNADSRELLCELLRRAGFDCHAAESGVAGLALIEELCPDIAILDLGLPEIDGFEMARRVRGNPKHANTILIALTGYGRDKDRAAGADAGFDQHLVKPVQAEQLLQLLAEMRSGTDRAGTSLE